MIAPRKLTGEFVLSPGKGRPTQRVRQPWLGSHIAHGHKGPTQLGGLKAAFLLEVPGR